MELLNLEQANGYAENVSCHSPHPSDAVTQELNRVLQSRSFQRARRLKALLRYVVTVAVDGKSTNERRTAQEVFGKSGDFSPTLDPGIRVQFGRLRKRLAQYYDDEGSTNPVVIEIPSRSYTPTFHIQDASQASIGQGEPILVKGAGRKGASVVEDREPANEEPGESELGPAILTGMQSVAVLPFANLTQDPKQDAFCYGLTEEIANALASMPSVNVVASSSAFQFKNEHVDVRDVGRELGVPLILEGSVRVERGQARVIAQLARCEDGVAIWSDSFDGKINGSLNTQRAIARKVLGSLPLGGPCS